MKIVSVKAFEIDLTPNIKSKPRYKKITSEFGREFDGFTSPMQKYSHLKRSDWSLEEKRLGCIITAEDGTWGFGTTIHSELTMPIINNHLAKLIEGENVMATEKMWDMMQKSTSFYGTAGLPSYAISAIDNALWDLKGKILKVPVYELIGGPQKDKIFVYASNTDFSYGTKNTIDWFLELGFKAVKLFLREGSDTGLEGINKSVELVAQTREQVGDSVEIALDAWMSLDVDYATRLVEALRPYKIKWLEDYMIPESTENYFNLRNRVPYQTLATGEHWYSTHPFAFAASHGLVDIFQPDLSWVGGLTAGIKICNIAQAHGLSVIPHASSNYPYGQHLAYAMPSVTWAERSEGVSPPGVPLEEMVRLPGTPTIKDGYVEPSDSPGFGFEFDLDWVENRAK